MQDNESILEAFVKSWVTGALDRAAARGSVSFTLVLHHLSSFIFGNCTDDKVSLRNKLAKSLLRDYSRKPIHEVPKLSWNLFNLINNWFSKVFLNCFILLMLMVIALCGLC